MGAVGWFGIGMACFGLLWLLVLGALQTYDTFRAWEYNRKKRDVPAKTPGPKTGLLPDGHFAYIDESSTMDAAGYYLAKRRIMPTPDRPAPDPFIERARAEITSITGPEVAAHIPREDQ